MKKSLLTVLLILGLALVMTACGGGGEEPAADAGNGASSIGDAANGERLFKGQTIGSAGSPGCITCHSLEPGVTLVGPAQNDVGARAASRVEGLSAEEYLRQSILEPNAHIVDGFAEGLMYQNYAEELPEPVVNDLIAYMLTLTGE